MKAALEREEEEKLLPRKRKRKSKNENEDDDQQHMEDEKNDSNKEETAEKKNEKVRNDKFKIPKKNPLAPPPLDFQSLLKLAEQKQHEPIMIEKLVEEKPERPMTSKEKEEYMKERERKMRREMLVTSSAKVSEPCTKVDTKLKNESKSAATMRSTDNKANSKALSSNSLPKTEVKKIPQKVERTEITSNSASKISNEVSSKPKISILDSKKIISKEGSSNKTSVKLPSNDKSKLQAEKLSTESKLLLMKKAKREYYAEQQRKNLDLKHTQLNNIYKKEKLPVANSDFGQIKLSGNTKVAKLSDKPTKLLEKHDTPKPSEKKPLLDSRSQPVKQFPSRDGVREFTPRDMVRQFPPRDVVKRKPPPVRKSKFENMI